MKTNYLQKTILLVALSFGASQTEAQPLPGSGDAILFTNSAPRSYITTDYESVANTFTIEAWVRPTATTPIFSQQSSGVNAAFGSNCALMPSNGGLSLPSTNAGAGFSVGTNGITVQEHGSDYFPSVLSHQVDLIGWNHIAIVYNNKIPSLYINGIFIKNGVQGGKSNVYVKLNNYNFNTQLGGIGGGTAGIEGNLPSFYDGYLDEFRVWEIALTEAQIRDRMCKSINASDPLFSSLGAYLKFDEFTGNTTVDNSGNGNSGTLVNAPSIVSSGAPIGAESVHSYVMSGLPSANLTYAGQDNLSVNMNFGTYTGEGGLHIYVVDGRPTNELGLNGLSSNNRYFGVFQANITDPSYTAVYNYTGNPIVEPANENSLVLFGRDNGQATQWDNVNAALDITGKTLTVSGQNTEYLLSGNCKTANVSLTPSGLNALWVNQGANDPFTFYYGVVDAKRINANISGGVGPFSFSWSNSGQDFLLPRAYYPANSIDLFRPLTSTWVKVDVTDQSTGCTYEDSIFINREDAYFCFVQDNAWYIQICQNGQTVCVPWNIGRDMLRNNQATLGSCQTAKDLSQNTIANTEMEIYPNPSSGVFHVVVTHGIDGELTLFDITGKRINTETKRAEFGVIEHNFDLGNLPKGMYFVQYTAGEILLSKKVVIKD